MKIITKLGAALLGFAFFGAIPLLAKDVEVGVKGMVCSFCARGIEKKFSAEPAVEKVRVDLKNKIVSLNLKPGQDLDEETIRDIIRQSGLAVEYVKTK